jgi:hypothetical protein
MFYFLFCSQLLEVFLSYYDFKSVLSLYIYFPYQVRDYAYTTYNFIC